MKLTNKLLWLRWIAEEIWSGAPEKNGGVWKAEADEQTESLHWKFYQDESYKFLIGQGLQL